jgi:diguanylate cyclase (GGDEF)-like protein
LTIAASSRRGLLWGNEEFAVVLPNTALRQALTVADHIRRAVMAKELKKKLTGEILGRVTISVGLFMLKPGRRHRRADRSLARSTRNTPPRPRARWLSAKTSP